MKTVLTAVLLHCLITVVLDLLSQVLWESTSNKDDASLLLHGTQTPWSAERSSSLHNYKSMRWAIGSSIIITPQLLLDTWHWHMIHVFIQQFQKHRHSVHANRHLRLITLTCCRQWWSPLDDVRHQKCDGCPPCLPPYHHHRVGDAGQAPLLPTLNDVQVSWNTSLAFCRI